MVRIALVVLGIGAASPAWALSCAWGPSDTVPEDGAVDVPLNTNIYVGVWGGASPDDFAVNVFDQATGQPVPASVTEVEADNASQPVWQITPLEPLQPETRYDVYFHMHDDLDNVEPQATFTTGAHLDETDPAAPVLLSAERNGGFGQWGRWRFNEVVLEHDEPGIFLVDVSADRAFGDFRTIATLGRVNEAGEVEFSVGSGICGGNTELSRNERHVRVRAMDLAGNLSELDADAAGVRAGGCSSTGAPAVGVGALLALMMLGLRRRKENR